MCVRRVHSATARRNGQAHRGPPGLEGHPGRFPKEEPREPDTCPSGRALEGPVQAQDASPKDTVIPLLWVT